jgi:hypothetical protein
VQPCVWRCRSARAWHCISGFPAHEVASFSRSEVLKKNQCIGPQRRQPTDHWLSVVAESSRNWNVIHPTSPLPFSSAFFSFIFVNYFCPYRVFSSFYFTCLSLSNPSSWYLFLILFSLLFLLFLILSNFLVFLSFLKSYTKCLLWLYSTDWLNLWSAVDNRTILELYQWSIFIVIIEWLNGKDNRNYLSHFNKLRRARYKHEYKLKEETYWETLSVNGRTILKQILRK